MTDGILTPQQELFLKSFLDPKSDTWSNYRKSALKAGYSEEYAKNLSHLMPDWLSDIIEDDKVLRKALNNLDLALDGNLDDMEKGPKQIQWKATETVLKGLQKDRWGEKKTLAVEGLNLETQQKLLSLLDNDTTSTS